MKKSEFDARYVEDLYIDGEKQPSLVVSLSLSQASSAGGCLWIYSIADLFEDMNLSNYQEILNMWHLTMKLSLQMEMNKIKSHQIVDGCKISI